MRDPEAIVRVNQIGAAAARGIAATRGHPAVAGTLATVAAAGAAVGMALRRLVSSPASTPGDLAELTAISVWDAAKGAVIEHVRELEPGAGASVLAEPAAAAVREAGAAGADITAAALGAVEGAAGVAPLLRVTRGEAIAAAAAASIAAAADIGPTAAIRVEQAIRERFGVEG